MSWITFSSTLENQDAKPEFSGDRRCGAARQSSSSTQPRSAAKPARRKLHALQTSGSNPRSAHRATGDFFMIADARLHNVFRQPSFVRTEGATIINSHLYMFNLRSLGSDPGAAGSLLGPPLLKMRGTSLTHWHNHINLWEEASPLREPASSLKGFQERRQMHTCPKCLPECPQPDATSLFSQQSCILLTHAF